MSSKRNLYIPSLFAKKTLIYLQEVGVSKTNYLNTNSRDKLDSYLFFIVISGKGTFQYGNHVQEINEGDCVFFDCTKPFSHTSDNFEIAWIHFNGNNVKDLYSKYIERCGKYIFNTNHKESYLNLINDIYDISVSDDYLRDMKIYEKLVSFLTIVMEETIYTPNDNKKIYNLELVKQYIEYNYYNSFSLDDLSKIFYINKYYLTRAFKKIYGKTISSYINELRIKKAKELLRFTSLSVDKISEECGYSDISYFSKVFKKLELLSPNKYRQLW